jgi:predicted GIY-YIG superfamily endonuclease
MYRSYFVYIVASRKNGTLYTGVTNDIVRRTWEHREGELKGFTRDHGVKRLVWFERYENIDNAIRREKQIKEWQRAWKIRLIEENMWRALRPILEERGMTVIDVVTTAARAMEIVRAERTDDASLATAFAVAKKLKKTSVLVKDAPAFVVNRILTRFMGSVLGAIDEGTPVEVADRALAPLGLPMSPIELLELVGPAVAHHVAGTLHAAFPDRFGVSENLDRVVKAGKRSFYVHDSGKPELDAAVLALFETGDTELTEEQVRDRALDAIAQEIGLMLDEGVVAAPEDVDLCLITGAGWPFHLGGITPYLDRAGVSERVLGKKFLAPGVASVPE